MHTKRILSAFAFTMLTIFLLLIVASRSGEAAAGDSQVSIDVNLGVAATPLPSVTPLPNSRDEQPVSTGALPEIDITSWEYRLANSEHNIGSYTPQVAAIEDTAQFFDERAVDALESFLDAARAAGFSPYIMNAYRSYSTQNYIYNGRASQIAWPDYPTEEDYAQAAQYVAPPGTSDHQTGLGVDITDRYYNSLDASQMDQELLAWLRDNCAEYGFILRYPSNRASITGWDEPWHFRYVGVEAARYIMSNNLCLEQFVALYD